MSTYYWDLYVCYVKQCERENYINDIDPNHYEMEWNHFWPESIFGDWPVGQWLTLKQHAIASALQTLVFKENCMFGGHKSYLPPALLELAWPYFCEAAVKRVEKLHEEKDENGKSLHNLKVHEKKDESGKSLNALKMNEKLHEKKDENGKSLHTLRLHAEKDENGKSLHTLKLHEVKDENGKSVLAVRMGKKVHAEKDESGKSVLAVRNGKKVNEEKDEFGRSKHAVEMTKKQHEEKDENGKSVFAVRNGKRGAENLHKEKDENGRSKNALKGGRAAALKSQRMVELIRISDREVFVFESIQFAADILGVCASNITAVCRGRVKTVGGYTARYLD